MGKFSNFNAGTAMSNIQNAIASRPAQGGFGRPGGFGGGVQPRPKFNPSLLGHITYGPMHMNSTRGSKPFSLAELAQGHRKMNQMAAASPKMETKPGKVNGHYNMGKGSAIKKRDKMFSDSDQDGN